MDGFNVFGMICALTVFVPYWMPGEHSSAQDMRQVHSELKDHKIDLSQWGLRIRIKKEYGSGAQDRFDIMVKAYVDRHGEKKLHENVATIVGWCESPEANVDHMLNFASGQEGSFSKMVCASSELRKSVQSFDRIVK